MSLFGGQPALGIAVSSQSVRVCQLRGAQSHTAVFPLAEQRLLREPAVAGREFAAFLKAQKFSAGRAIIGLPAQWLICKEKTLPVASMDATAAMLNLQMERDFSLEPESLVLDFSAGTDGPEGRPIVLFASTRGRIEKLIQFALAAKLKITAITASSLALARTSGRDNLIYIGENGAEAAFATPRHAGSVRYIGSTIAMRKGSAAEFARTLELALGGAVPKGTTVWDDVEIGAERLAELFPGCKLAAGADSGAPPGNSAGQALAQCGMQPELLEINFVRSRLVRKPPSKITSKRVWAGVAGVAVLAAGAYLVLDWSQSAADLAELKQRRDEMKTNVTAAKDFIANVNATREFYDRRPNYLECLRTLTLSFPDAGQVWATSLTMRDDMRGVLTARATDEKKVLELFDKLKGSAGLSDLKLLQMRAAEGKTSEVSFSIGFAYVGVK